MESVLMYTRHMKHINNTTVYLQKHLLKLCDCVGALDILTGEVETQKNIRHSTLEDCKLSDRYIGLNAQILTDKDFRYGLEKIQTNNAHTMIHQEVFACRHLEMNIDVQVNEEQDNPCRDLKIEEKLQQAHKRARTGNDKMYTKT